MIVLLILQINHIDSAFEQKQNNMDNISAILKEDQDKTNILSNRGRNMAITTDKGHS